MTDEPPSAGFGRSPLYLQKKKAPFIDVRTLAKTIAKREGISPSAYAEAIDLWVDEWFEHLLSGKVVRMTGKCSISLEYRSGENTYFPVIPGKPAARDGVRAHFRLDLKAKKLFKERHRAARGTGD